MTENKRFIKFKLIHNDDVTVDFGVKDNLTNIYYHTTDYTNAINFGKLLNELYNENEQLKQEYQKLKHRHSLLHDECLDTECERDSLKKDVNSLEEDNEQLKQFKENVIKWVDSQMKFNGKKYIETEDDHFKNENIDLHNFKVIIGIDSDD